MRDQTRTQVIAEIFQSWLLQSAKFLDHISATRNYHKAIWIVGPTSLPLCKQPEFGPIPTTHVWLHTCHPLLIFPFWAALPLRSEKLLPLAACPARQFAPLSLRRGASDGLIFCRTHRVTLTGVCTLSVHDRKMNRWKCSLLAPCYPSWGAFWLYAHRNAVRDESSSNSDRRLEIRLLTTGSEKDRHIHEKFPLCDRESGNGWDFVGWEQHR